MNITDITSALEAIKALPIDRINERQSMLVNLLAEMVNNETCDGDDTDLNTPLEGQDWWQTLKYITKDAGFSMLGNGHFSAAYAHPLLPHKVIKVGFKKEDSGAAYIAFCRMHQGRPGIPNIYDVQRHNGCYTVVLDMLNESEIYGNDTHDYYADMARDIIEHNSQEYNELTGWDAEFAETCRMIRKFFNGIASFDMHSGNIMFTNGDVPYITDPVSFTANKEKTLSVEPEELLKEIEELAAQAKIDKAIARHKRNADRLMARRGRRGIRKDCKRRKKNQRAWILRNRMEAFQNIRNEERARMMLGGTFNWANAWGRMPLNKWMHKEAALGAKMMNHDHLAIQAGQPLMIDKQLDAMFMG